MSETRLIRPTAAVPSSPAVTEPHVAVKVPMIKPAAATSEESRHVLERVGVDALSAAAAAVLVAPIITIIDKGIIENATGRNTLMKSLKSSFVELVTHPHRFIAARPFRLIYTLYFGTYCSANWLDTAVALKDDNKDYSARNSGIEKLVATSTVNMSLCLYKDKCFTQMFSTTAPRPVPLPSYLLFSARDLMTIFFSFNVPGLVEPYIPKSKYLHADNVLFRPDLPAQIFAPAFCQLFSTPLHLLGLDLYNRGDKLPWKQRWEMVKRAWAPSAAARICRIVPAFGFGGVTNNVVRRSLMGKIQDGRGQWQMGTERV